MLVPERSGQNGDAVHDVGEGGRRALLVLLVVLTLSQVQLVAVGVLAVQGAGKDLNGAVSQAGSGLLDGFLGAVGDDGIIEGGQVASALGVAAAPILVNGLAVDQALQRVLIVSAQLTRAETRAASGATGIMSSL